MAALTVVGVGTVGAWTLGTEPAEAAFSTSSSSGHAVRTASLSAPTSLSAVNRCELSGLSVDVSWVNAEDDHTHVRIERRVGGTTTWSSVGTVARGATSYRDPTARLLTMYSYRAVGLLGTWQSAPSVLVTMTTLSRCA